MRKGEVRRDLGCAGCWFPFLSEGVTSEVLNHTYATTMISTSNLFLGDKKENTNGHKNGQKIFLQVNAPLPPKYKMNI